MGLYSSIVYLDSFLLGTALYTSYLIKMQIIKRSTMTTSTYRLHRMLFNAISAQLFIAYSFLLFPSAALGLMIFFQVQNTGKYVSLVLTLMSVHSFLDCLAIMYFITPYRKTIMKWLGLKQRY